MIRLVLVCSLFSAVQAGCKTSLNEETFDTPVLAEGGIADPSTLEACNVHALLKGTGDTPCILEAVEIENAGKEAILKLLVLNIWIKFSGDLTAMDSVFPSAIILSEQPLIWLDGTVANGLLDIVKFRETIPKPKLKALFITTSKGSLQQEFIDALKKSAQYFELRYNEDMTAAK